MSTRIKEQKKSVTKRPIKTAGYTQFKANARRAQKRSEAVARQAAYAAPKPGGMRRPLPEHTEFTEAYFALRNTFNRVPGI